MRAMVLALLAVGCQTSGELAPAPPTFDKDVGPMLDRYCVRCHDGFGIGPGDFRDYATVAPLAPLMIQRVEAGEMPPPASDPECRSYLDSDRFVVDPSLAPMLTDWVNAKTPEGDPATTPATETAPADHLDDADYELSIAAPYTPDFVDNNEYRCFLLDYDEDVDQYLTGLEFIEDHPAVSHHAVLYLDTDGTSESYVTDPTTQSWRCDVSPNYQWSYLHAWAPGGQPVRFDPGTGLKLPAHQKLVLQMHYYRGGDDPDHVQDLPGYRLTTAPTVTTQMYYYPIGPESFRIPAGDAHYTASEEYSLSEISGGLPLTLTIYGGMAHMHVLGEHYNVRYQHPDGTDTCLFQGDYDFANQLTYWYDEPAVIPPDDGTLKVACTWDNSADNPNQINETPQDVEWGENTNDEMCFAFLYFSAAF